MSTPDTANYPQIILQPSSKITRPESRPFVDNSPTTNPLSPILLHLTFILMPLSAPMSPVIPDRTYLPLTYPPMPQLFPPHPDLPSLGVASLSRATLVHQRPQLFHALHQEHSSVLSLAADDRNVYAGSQDGQISVCLAFPINFYPLTKFSFCARFGTSIPSSSEPSSPAIPEVYWLSSMPQRSTGSSVPQVHSAIPVYNIELILLNSR